MTKQLENITGLVLCITDVCLQLCVASPLLPPLLCQPLFPWDPVKQLAALYIGKQRCCRL